MSTQALVIVGVILAVVVAVVAVYRSRRSDASQMKWTVEQEQAAIKARQDAVRARIDNPTSAGPFQVRPTYGVQPPKTASSTIIRRDKAPQNDGVDDVNVLALTGVVAGLTTFGGAVVKEREPDAPVQEHRHVAPSTPDALPGPAPSPSPSPSPSYEAPAPAYSPPSYEAPPSSSHDSGPSSGD